MADDFTHSKAGVAAMRSICFCRPSRAFAARSWTAGSASAAARKYENRVNSSSCFASRMPRCSSARPGSLSSRTARSKTSRAVKSVAR